MRKILVLVAVWSSLVRASTIVPNGTAIPSNETGNAVFSFLASMTSAFSSGTLSGSLTSEIYSVAPDVYQGWYMVTVGPNSVDDLSRLTIDGYYPALGDLDVGYRTDLGAGTVAPTSADRAYYVLGASFAPKVMPGATSAWFVVQFTDAYGYSADAAAIIDGTAINTTAYGPMPPPGSQPGVFEPPNWTLLLCGAGGLFGLRALQFRTRRRV